MKQVQKINVNLNYRMMSMQQTDVSPMDLLGQRLREKFPEITGGSASAGNDYFHIEIAEGTEDAPFMKALDGFVKEYLTAHGDPEIEYNFSIDRGHQLVNVITYNSDDRGYLVDVRLDGKSQSLFVVDVQGATGDFTVFNDNFETVGFINMKDTGVTGSDPDSGDERPFPNFGDSSLWEASNIGLTSALREIIEQIAAQLGTGEKIDAYQNLAEFVDKNLGQKPND